MSDGFMILVPQLIPRPLANEAVMRLRQHRAACDDKGQFPLTVRLQEPSLRAMALYVGQYGLPDRTNAHCHWPPMARCVEPDADHALWPMHRDTEYNEHIQGPFVSVWVPLVMIDTECGGLCFPHDTLPSLHPGDAVIMSHDCLHASAPNRSTRPRISCDFRFFGASTMTSKHYLDIATGEVIAPC